ncbi:MAG TPA: ribonuclease P protein component [Chitinophagaceae bacterium]|nr:ribonuclease P protein component [Chitinophagaceae bacterium]
MSGKFSLGKKERIKSRKLIEEIFKSGKRFSEGSYRVFYTIRKNDASNLQFATGVSGKVFKRAVDRNKIKRLTRETWRMQKQDLLSKFKNNKSGLYVFITYTGNEIPAYQEVYKMINNIIKKLNEITGS